MNLTGRSCLVNGSTLESGPPVWFSTQRGSYSLSSIVNWKTADGVAGSPVWCRFTMAIHGSNVGPFQLEFKPWVALSEQKWVENCWLISDCILSDTMAGSEDFANHVILHGWRNPFAILFSLLFVSVKSMHVCPDLNFLITMLHLLCSLTAYQASVLRLLFGFRHCVGHLSIFTKQGNAERAM